MKIHRSLAVLTLALLGCRSSTLSGRTPAPPDPGVELPGDPEVETHLETLSARTTESNGRTLLHMELRNKSGSQIAFAWAVEWFDRSGKLVGGAVRAWESMTLAAGATRSIEVPVPSPEASSWRLRAVRPG